MALVRSVIPNLIGGVSQQAPQSRARNASKYELNTMHSLVSGLCMRPPTKWVTKLHNTSSVASDAAVHSFTASSGAEFLLVVDAASNGSARLSAVRTSDGAKYTVDLSGDAGYISGLTGNFNDSVRFMSVGDTVFILNRTIIPASSPISEDVATADIPYDITAADFASLPFAGDYSPGTVAKLDNTGAYYETRYTVVYTDFDFTDVNFFWAPISTATANGRKDPSKHGTVYIRQAVHSTKYYFQVFYEDGTSDSAYFKTPDAVNSTGDPVPISTETIVNSLNTAFSGTHATVTKNGSTLSISATKAITKVISEDGFGDQAMRAFAASVQNFSDLPPNEIEGRVVRISGAVETGGDDYFVEYKDGKWFETVGFNARTQVDSSTMPATVVYSPSSNTFSLVAHEWPGRTSGDAESNPKPTFVGRAINDMFLFKGRLCLLSDENVIFSEVGYYENFYRTTLTQLLETDPIDIAATTSTTAMLHSGVAFDETLVLFSRKQQFRILSGDSLTPQNIEIVPTTAYNSSRSAQPLQVGQNVFFVEDYPNSQYGTIMEYFRNPNTDSDDAASVTSAVPKYIPNNIRRIRGSANANTVAVLTAGNTGEFFVYTYFWSGGEKAISSWTTWKLSGVSSILSLDFFGDDLYLICKGDDSSVFVLKCSLEEGRFDAGTEFNTHLDVQLLGSDCTPSYQPATERTLYTLPFSIPAGLTPVVSVRIASGDYPVGLSVPIESHSGSQLYVEGDTSSVDVVIGFAYEMIYDFSPQYIRKRVGNGEVVDQQGRLSLRYFELYFDDTAFFEVEVSSEGRDTRSINYTSRTLQSAASMTDLFTLKGDSFRVPVRGKAAHTGIRIINSTPFPCAFTSASWEAQYSPKAQSI